MPVLRPGWTRGLRPDFSENRQSVITSSKSCIGSGPRGIQDPAPRVRLRAVDGPRRIGPVLTTAGGFGESSRSLSDYQEHQSATSLSDKPGIAMNLDASRPLLRSLACSLQHRWILASLADSQLISPDLNLSPSGLQSRQIIWRLFGFAPQCTRPRQSAPKIQRNSKTAPNNEISRWVTAA